MVRATATVTPLFNGFFASMDRTFGYGAPKSEEELAAWWSRDLRTTDLDTTLGAGKSNW
jgi:hypothetical protein